MSAVDELREKLLQANERLAIWHQRVDQEWERLKQAHIARTGNALGYISHLEEMSKQARATVEVDPTSEVFAILDGVADASLNLPPDGRQVLSDCFADCRELERVHRGYIVARAAKQMRTTRDVIWLRRGLVVAALSQGGADLRDLHVALAELWDAASAAQLDPAPEFRRIGALSSTNPGRGGLQGSVGEFLAAYRR